MVLHPFGVRLAAGALARARGAGRRGASSAAEAAARVRAAPETAAAAQMRGVLQAQLDAAKAAGTYKEERVIETAMEPSIAVRGRASPVINMCANNYLGLSNHPELVKAAHATLDSHGFGLSSVRFICGTQDLHKRLEDKISEFHGTEDTILYPSCFDANAGLFEAILTKEDAILSDQLNHASIIDGVRLCKAQRFRYKHIDMEDLEAKLVEAKDCRLKLVATDGVFSMDGHIAPMKEICELAEKHGAMVFMDECHASGFLGKTGRGTDEYCGLAPGTVDIINSTLGKALGGATGGYTTGRKEVIDILRQKARPYLFSNSLAPPVVGAGIKVFEMLSKSTELRDKLEHNTKLFRAGMSTAGFNIPAGDHPIVPIMLGDAKLAHAMADRLLEKGIYVIGFSYPVVPMDTARIRVQISAAHSEADLQVAMDAFKAVGKELGCIE